MPANHAIVDNYTIFTSDAHLSPAEPQTAELFLTFLANINQRADALYILGDLFKFWVGDDNQTKFNQTIQQALKQLSTKVPVYLMPGNRDFTLGQEFARAAGCTLLPDPYVIDLYGERIILTHGDMLCTKDTMHCLFRAITRLPCGIKLFLSLPIKFRLWLATTLQNYSAKAKSKKSKLIMLPQPKAITQLLNQYHATRLIHGHTHIVTTTSNRLALGEWQSNKINVLLCYQNGNIAHNN